MSGATLDVPARRLRPKFKPQPKQVAFFELCEDPDAEEILFDGAIRAGKTQAACAQVAAWAYRFGGTHLVGRRTYQELEDTTKKAMLRGDGDMPPALPPELIRREWPTNVAGGNKVQLWNGAEILFRSLEDAKTAEDKVKNLTLCSYMIDQAEELDDDRYEDVFYETLVGRLSDPRGPRKGILLVNPAPETHWIYRRFIAPETRRPQTRRISVTLMDNAKVLPPDYVERMLGRRSTAPEWYERMVLGKWGAFGGKRFKCFRKETHVVEPFPVPAEWEVTEGGDFGSSAPTCWEWHAVAPDGHEYFVAEHYEAERPVSHHAARIREIRKTLNLSPSATWLDPSAWATARQEYSAPAFEFAEQGIDAGRAQNDRLGGWNRMEELLIARVGTCTCPVERPDSPRLLVFERCPNLVKQLRSARYKQGLDDIEKKNDHALDAARYVVMSRPFIAVKPVSADDDRLRRYVRRVKERADQHRQGELILEV